MKLSADTLKLLASTGVATALVGSFAYSTYTIMDYDHRLRAAARRGEYIEPPPAVVAVEWLRYQFGMKPLYRMPCGMCGMG